MIEVHGDQSRPHMVFAVARRHNLGSFVTRAVDPGARWGHTAFFDRERGVMIEALLFKGVVETPIEKWLATYPSYEFIAVNTPEPDAGALWQREQVGKGYDYLGATSVPWRTSWQDTDRWYCSEKDAYSLIVAGRQWVRDPKRGIHPHDFWRFTV
jgi:hypothetical protein